MSLERPANPLHPDAARLVSTAEREPKPPELVHLGGIVSDAPALELFRPERGQDWTKATIRNYFITAPAAGREDVRTIAAFSNGAPALIQKKLGEGESAAADHRRR